MIKFHRISTFTLIRAISCSLGVFLLATVCLPAAQNRLHALNELLVVIWLTNVIIHTNSKTLHLRLNRTLGRHKEEWNFVALRTQLRRKLNTITIWQSDIKYQKVRFPSLNHLHRPMRIVGCFDLIAFLAEEKPHECRSKTIVINDKNVHLSLFFLSTYHFASSSVQSKRQET